MTATTMTQPDYFIAYRSLRLTRDAEGVLVVEFHSNDRPLIFTARDHTEFVDAFLSDLSGSGQQDRDPDGNRRGFYCRHRLLIVRQRR